MKPLYINLHPCVYLAAASYQDAPLDDSTDDAMKGNHRRQ
jgi:hypothetical protein